MWSEKNKLKNEGSTVQWMSRWNCKRSNENHQCLLRKHHLHAVDMQVECSCNDSLTGPVVPLVIKCLHPSSWKKEGFTLSHSSRVQHITAGKWWPYELEIHDHITWTVRGPRKLILFLASFSFYMQYKIQANGKMLSSFREGLLTSVYLFWNSPLQASIEVNLT